MSTSTDFRDRIGALGAALAVAAAAAERPSHGQSIDRGRLPVELAHLAEEEVARIARMSPLPPLPPDPTNRWADDEAAAELGQRLFFDRTISPAGVSCATCHDPARWFTDGRPLARGLGESVRNAPSVVDAARRRWLGWDGKFDSLWSQALAPIEHPAEMGSDRRRLLAVVRDDPLLRTRYEAIFGRFPAALERREGGRDPLATAAPRGEESTPAGEDLAPTIDRAAVHLLKAIGAYQRRLASGPAPIDRFVAALRGQPSGDPEALDAAARRGLATFVSTGGCYQCHRGSSFTDEEFHNLGFVGKNGAVPDDPARLVAVDDLKSNPLQAGGAFSDGPESPKARMVEGLRRSAELFGQFRTAPLRGVAATAPYMHDGRLPTLDDVVRFYDTLDGAAPVGHHGESVLVPLGLGEAGRADLVAFLRALSGGAPDARWTVNPASDSAPRAVEAGR